MTAHRLSVFRSPGAWEASLLRAGLVTAGFLLLVVPALGAALPIVVPPVPEQVVEGHSVFTIVEFVVEQGDLNESFHAAVAILVREVSQQGDFFRIPGVLWFNDQFLTGPSRPANADQLFRYPCTGAILAAPAGTPDPRPANASDQYVKSYRVTDPNDNGWDIDVWRADVGLPTERFVWTVPINNNQAGYNVTDDGVSKCSPKADNPCAGAIIFPFANDEATPIYEDDGPAEGRHTNLGKRFSCNAQFVGYRDPGTNTRGYPCGRGKPADPVDPNAPTGTPHPYDAPKCPMLSYNGLLYFDFDDLVPSGMRKNHSAGSTDRANDVSGCHGVQGFYYGNPTSPPFWPCPGGNDMREGNSHDYNPRHAWPRAVSDGRDNHGGSADCDGDGTPDAPNDRYRLGDFECHAMANIDLYYAQHKAPTVRVYAVVDTEGSTAPFYCTPGQTPCSEDDL